MPSAVRGLRRPDNLHGWKRFSTRPEPRVAFRHAAHDDASTLRSIDAITAALEPLDPRASMARAMAAELLKMCDSTGALPAARRGEAPALIAMIEAALQ